MASAIRHIDIDGSAKMLAIGYKNSSVAILNQDTWSDSNYQEIKKSR